MQNPKPESKSRLDLICLANVKPESVSWLWEPYIPVGGITLLAGDPGVGKTHLALLIAASVTIGASLPTNGIEDDEPRCREPSNVIYMTGEDDLAATIRPRFDKLGGDPNRFFAIEGIVDTLEGKEIRRGFSLSEMPRWEQKIAAVRPKALIVDPIQAFLGSHVDMHRANEVRPVMDGIGKIAAKYGIAVIMLCHSPKGVSDKAVHKVLGSIDLPAVARSVCLAGPNPQVEQIGLKDVFGRDDQEDRWDPVLRENKCVLVHIKSNLAAKGPSIGYVIGDGTVSLTGPVDVSEEQMMGRTQKFARPRQTATEFLLEELKAGPKASTELQSSADDRGISPSTLKRAAKKLGVICRSGFGQPWTWTLPTSNASGLPKAPPSASESAAAQEASIDLE
jgi:hypothetical protein